MKQQYRFKKIGPSFGSRALGKRIREELKPKILSSDKFVFDLKDVRMVSYSFADEFFGKLSLEIKEDYKKTKLENANEFVKHIIEVAIKRRSAIGS